MTLTVSQLNNQIKSLLESTFERVTVRGEISRITHHSSGHIYFDIKDGSSALNCVMFRGNASKLKFRLEQGQDIVLDAVVSVYIPRGNYQLNCFGATPAGEGALALAYEQLKKKLESKGYFDPIHKKELPKFPKHIAIVTSKTGAALQDMLRVASKRYQLLKITLINSLVQGESANLSVAKSIKKAESLDADIIIVGRGGGSIEDLWCFNEEIVAEAIFHCKTPIISAVGHEIDYVISDFVADIRAATPSNAMEIALPDSYEMLIGISERINNFHRNFNSLIERKQYALSHTKELITQSSPKLKLERKEKDIEEISLRLNNEFKYILERKQSVINPLKENLQRSKDYYVSKKEMTLSSMKNNLEALDPKRSLKDGFSQVIKDKMPVNLEKLMIDDKISLVDKNTKIEAKVIKKKTL